MIRLGPSLYLNSNLWECRVRLARRTRTSRSFSFSETGLARKSKAGSNRQQCRRSLTSELWLRRASRISRCRLIRCRSSSATKQRLQRSVLAASSRITTAPCTARAHLKRRQTVTPRRCFPTRRRKAWFLRASGRSATRIRHATQGHLFTWQGSRLRVAQTSS